MADTPGREFYDRQIEYLRSRDVDGLVAQQYRPDATLVGFEFTRRGSDELRAHFHDYLERLGRIELLSTDQFTETDDAIFFEATVRTDLGEARVYDVFVLEDGKASHHFTGVISLAPAAPQEA